MAEKLPIFTVDWETYLDAIDPHWSVLNDGRIEEPTSFLLDILDKYEVRALFYILGMARFRYPDVFEEIKSRGHALGDHGFWHEHNLSLKWHSYNRHAEEPFRSPYWDTTPMPWPPSGGFFFRALPLEIVKSFAKKSGVFWLHPHDIDEDHPRLKNPLLNWKRHVGLKGARKKLERLLSEVKFGNPKV